MKTATHSFFDRPTLVVARDLIGCYLVRRIGGRMVRAMITETEAYDGFEDKASHAHRGMTERNEVMFRSAGHIYVYFTYGIHWLINLVTGPAGYPAAVLIRGAELPGGERLRGPAVLTKALGIDGALNGKKLSRSVGLWIETPGERTRARIKTSPRVGVDSSGPRWSRRRFRFFLEEKKR